MRVLGVIPARLSSTRLPRKVLREIAGLPMVVQVFRRARRSPLLSELLVATDSENGVRCRWMWYHRSMYYCECLPRAITNIRAVAEAINRASFRDDPDVPVTTLRSAPRPVASHRQQDQTAPGDPLFSRLPIPFDRDGRGGSPTGSRGALRYRRAVLDFHSLPPSALEQAEKLEQLRLLENGIPIRVVETEEETIGVDTEEDLRLAEARLAARAR